MKKNTINLKFVLITVVVCFSLTVSARVSLAQEIKLRLAHHFALNDSWSVATNEFAKLVGERSNGRIVIKVFGGGELGAERDYLEGLQLGTVDLGVAGPGVMANFSPLIGIFDLPFLYKSYDHANRVMDGSVGQKVFDSYAYEEQGY